MFTLPSETPVTVPVETVAIEGVALDHIPVYPDPIEVEFERTIFDPTFTADKPVILFIEGSAFTVVEIVFDEAGLPIAQVLSEVTVA
jgi:hypothetical protein